jgi:hypothetical protein
MADSNAYAREFANQLRRRICELKRARFFGEQSAPSDVIAALEAYAGANAPAREPRCGACAACHERRPFGATLH